MAVSTKPDSWLLIGDGHVFRHIVLSGDIKSRRSQTDQRD
jgi:hypothetical protein